MTAKGMGLEKYLDGLHRLYVAQGRALIFKVPTPVQIKRHTGGIKVSGEKRPAVWVDYSGVLKGGLGVAIEAKHCTSRRWGFPLNRFSSTQRAVMTDMHAMGGVAAAFVRGGFLMETHDYLIPVPYLDALERKSVKWDAVQHFKIPPGKSWLDAITAQPKHLFKPIARDAWASYCKVGWAWLDECPDD